MSRTRSWRSKAGSSGVSLDPGAPCPFVDTTEMCESREGSGRAFSLGSGVELFVFEDFILRLGLLGFFSSVVAFDLAILELAVFDLDEL